MYFICTIRIAARAHKENTDRDFFPLFGLNMGEGLNVLTILSSKWHAEMCAPFPVNSKLLTDSTHCMKQNSTVEVNYKHIGAFA